MLELIQPLLTEAATMFGSMIALVFSGAAVTEFRGKTAGAPGAASHEPATKPRPGRRHIHGFRLAPERCSVLASASASPMLTLTSNQTLRRFLFQPIWVQCRRTDCRRDPRALRHAPSYLIRLRIAPVQALSALLGSMHCVAWVD